MNTNLTAGILTAKPVDYTLFSFRELTRRARTEPGAAEELRKRQRANVERKARWSDPEYQAQQAAHERELIDAQKRKDEDTWKSIMAFNTDYKSAVDAMNVETAYTWFVLTSEQLRNIDMLTGAYRLNGHEPVALENANEIHKYLAEVYPDFPERLMDSRLRTPPTPVEYSPSLDHKSAPVRPRRFKTW